MVDLKEERRWREPFREEEERRTPEGMGMEREGAPPGSSVEEEGGGRNWERGAGMERVEWSSPGFGAVVAVVVP